ncbi:MAG TPA: hypothetical protein VGS19_32250 [Streptosporangiaceae bacterium]|nr:hypothetical protein [Streptosporangiaceae bacterium]
MAADDPAAKGSVKIVATGVSHRASVVIVSGSMGSGHDQVAAELSRRLAALGIRSAVIDILHCLRPGLGAALRSGYHATATFAPWLLNLGFQSTQPDQAASSDLLARWAQPALRRRLGGSAVAVSVHPFATQALGALKSSGGYPGHTLSYLTDPAPHTMWLHPSVDHHLTVTEQTARVAADTYHVDVVCGGPLAAPRFREPVPATERSRLRRELGADDSAVLALLMSGAHGLGQAGRSAIAVRAAGLHPVVVCGRNEALRARMARRNIAALGWRDDVHRLMAAADILVHNAGGLTLTEALVAGLPALTFLPVAGHGVANARFLDEHGIAPWARSVADLAHHGRILAKQRRLPLPAATETMAGFVASLCA